MKILKKTSPSDIATVYLAEFENGKYVEFVESVQPPIPFHKKWVLIISTMCGCPVSCSFCDAGSFYNGKLSYDELMAQIDFLIKLKFQNNKINIEKFKIQFARMGDPAFNPAVLEVLRKFPQVYDAPGFLPSVSSIAPASSKAFFDELTEIKNGLYQGNFQLQFSIHTTNEVQRDEIIPSKKLSFKELTTIGENFVNEGDKKITLNFAMAEGYEIDADKLFAYFDPSLFIIKLTPVNPTVSSYENHVKSLYESKEKRKFISDKLMSKGYDIIESYGEFEENKIGSNCGQFIRSFAERSIKLHNAYDYKLEDFK